MILNIVNSIGWSMFAFLLSFVLIVVLKTIRVTLSPVTGWCILFAVAVFLITL